MLKSIKKIIISLIAISLVISVACTTFATEGKNKTILDEVNEMLQAQNGTIGDDESAEQIPEGNRGNNTTQGTNNNNVTTPGNTNSNENLPESTPYTGIGDYSGLIFVGIFAVSAIYAYKKVKEYNA